MKYRVRVTAAAKSQIRDFVGYIARVQQEPQQALRVLEMIEAAIPTLGSFPHRCPLAPENVAVGYTLRMLIIKQTLLLLLRIDDDRREVTVVGFRHARQLPPTPSDRPRDP